MFKSIFAKYLTTFMLILIVSIIISTSIITSLVNTYDGNNKNRVLENVTEGVVNIVVREYSGSDSDSFKRYVNEYSERIVTLLDAMASNLDDIVVFITDENGKVELVGGSEYSETYADSDGHSLSVELAIPGDVFAFVLGGETVKRNDDLDGFFGEKHRTYITPILTDEGKTVGAVMASTMRNDMDELLERMIKTIVISTLWLMLAALIAVYFMTERLVSPLRAMSRASKEFARGQFDVRVPVHGDDEVAQLAEAFNNMAGSLQRSEETRRLFLANVSHDLRTPMTTISGFIDSIISGAIPEEQIPHYLNVISSEVRRLSRLVTSLLDITKIQAGERTFAKTPFDICEMAREIIISSEQRLEEKHLDVQFDADYDNMFVNADRDAIHQVLYNLCDNAIKFSKEGGQYILSIKDISSSKTEISIYNEGDGISPEDLPLVFDRFYKSDRSRGLDKTGVGLGLYISRTIIEAHGEKISVDSKYGEWCRFRFTLPRREMPKLKDDKRSGEFDV